MYFPVFKNVVLVTDIGTVYLGGYFSYFFFYKFEMLFVNPNLNILKDF